MSAGIPRPRTTSFSLHISTTATHSSFQSSGPSTNSPSNLGRVPLDARVVLSKRRAGYVRFIGKLKSENGEWYGVALDEAKGDNDGRWLGDTCFQCAANHGVFVRRKEIFYVKEQPSNLKSPPSPVTNDASEDGSGLGGGSSTSSGDSVVSHDSHDSAATVSPVSTATSTATPSPLQRTFKSFHHVLQSPAKLGQSLLSGASTPPAKPSTPTRRTPTRASMIPPPAITSVARPASRHQSIACPSPTELRAAAPIAASCSPEKHGSPTSQPASIFDEDHGFAAMTQALAEQNNLSTCTTTKLPAACPVPLALPLPPQIESPASSRETSPAASPQRRPTAERRHSTFAMGTPSTVSSAVATATANAVRVVDLEKEIGTMRTNHENVVAVLRATNKQHAANVLELRAQVSALTDGNGYLQRQLSLKSAQLQDLKQSERAGDHERAELLAQLDARGAKIQQLEAEIDTLKSDFQTATVEKESVLVQMQKEFQARQQRDREQVRKLREDVVSLCNARNALQAELQDTKELSFFF